MMYESLTLIYASERLLIVAIAGMCIWLGWRLLSSPTSSTSLLNGWQRFGRGAISVAFAVVLVGFGGWLLIKVESKDASPTTTQAANTK